MQTKVTVWDYFFLARPILLIPVWAFLLLGYYRAGGGRFSFELDFLVTVCCYTFLLSALYILNQIADVRTDAINKKHLLLAEKMMPVSYAYVEFAVLMIASFILTLRLPGVLILFIALSFLSGVAYSLPPLKFKGKPIVDFVINAVGFGFLNFSIGWLTVKPFTVQTMHYALPYVFAVGAIFINTTILDIKGDARDRNITTGILLGRRNAMVLSTLLIGACIAASVLVCDWLCLVPAAVALPFYIYALLKHDTKSIMLSIGIGGPLLVLLTGLVFPYFLILFLLVFIFLRIYYRERFGIEYPSLAVSPEQNRQE